MFLLPLDSVFYFRVGHERNAISKGIHTTPRVPRLLIIICGDPFFLEALTLPQRVTSMEKKADFYRQIYIVLSSRLSFMRHIWSSISCYIAHCKLLTSYTIPLKSYLQLASTHISYYLYTRVLRWCFFLLKEVLSWQFQYNQEKCHLIFELNRHENCHNILYISNMA